jgi:hypothetical protein
MTAHVNSGQIARYVSRTLPPTEILALHGHLETCPACRNALEEATLAGMPAVNTALLLGNVSDPHLSEEEMVAFVAGRLPENRQPEAARHLAVCEVCRDSVAAMEAVRDEPAGGSVRVYGVRWYALAGAIAATLLVGAVIHYWPLAGRPGTPAIVASLRDADGLIELDANGTLRGLENASPAEQNLVRDSLRRRALPAGPSAWAGAPGVLLSLPSNAPQAPFAPIGPMNTRVLSDRPVFAWQPYPGASAYEVLVTNEKLEPLARSGRTTATQWQPETPLPRATVLLWQIRAWHNGEMVSTPAPPAQPARFEIAGTAVAARLDQLRAQPRPSHMLAAVLCAQEGLRDEAAKEIQALARENPASPLVGSFESRAGSNSPAR